jgi:hypothetical protein
MIELKVYERHRQIHSVLTEPSKVDAENENVEILETSFDLSPLGGRLFGIYTGSIPVRSISGF